MNRRANTSPRALQAVSGMMETLESRVHLSAFSYEELPAFTEPSSPLWVLRPAGDGSTEKTIGTAVDGVGDVNGDGFDDVIVGVGGVKLAQADDQARAIVYSGQTGLPIYTLSDGFGEFGTAVAGVGDINGDHTPDFMIGSPGWSSTGAAGPGRAYLYSGADGSLLRTFTGAASGDRFGAAVAAAGDINKDGTIDLIIGSPNDSRAGAGRGRADVFSGADGSMIYTLTGFTPGSHLGYSVAGAGDVDQDGYADVIVGAPGDTTGSVKAPGHAFVYSGRSKAVIWQFDGHQNRDQFGFAVDSLGDINGDNFPDLIVGAPGADGEGPGTPNGGEVQVYSGADASVLYTFKGDRPNGNMGSVVTGIGDVNFDGRPDMMIGMPAANSDARVDVRSGADGHVLASYVVSDLTLVGSDRLGASAAAAGDVNHDGFIDFIFAGTQDANPEKNDRARAYVFSGARAAGLMPEGLNDAGDVWGAAGGESFVVLNSDLFLTKTRSGFQSQDHVIDVNDKHQVLGAVDSRGETPFLWVDGQRSELLALIKDYVGGTGTYSGLRAVDMTDSGLILVERLRDGTVPTTWMYNNGKLTYLFDGVPVAMNEGQTVLGTVSGADNKSILWTAGTGPVEITGLTGVALNENGDFVGTVTGTSSQAAIWSGGLTVLPAVTGGEAFVPTAINNKKQVVGSYTITSSHRTSGFFYDPAEGAQEIRPLVTSGATARFTDSTDLTLAGINNHSTIAGRLEDIQVGFIATSFDASGPFDTKFNSRISAVLPTNEGLAVVTVNRAGETILFRRDITTGAWTVIDLGKDASAPRANDTVTWNDPVNGRAVVGASTDDGLLAIAQDDAGTWSVRNLTTEVAGATVITHGLITFTSIDGQVFVAGINAGNDLVVYRNTAGTWTYSNLYENDLRPDGKATPVYVGPLTAYVTPWNGLNVAGLDDAGHVQAVWTAPGMDHWSSDDLTVITGAPRMTGSLAPYITSWGGINLAGVDENGDTVVTWWVPGFGGDWRQNNFTSDFGGPRFRVGSVSSYVTPWDGLNIAGLNDQGQVIVYWWVPGFSKWELSELPLGGDPHLERPVDRVDSYTGRDGSINLMGVGKSGDVLRMHWEPGADWHVENLTTASQG